LTLIGIDDQDAKEISRQLSVNKAFLDWNRKAHHQYSAALAQYLDFLKYNTNDINYVKSANPLGIKVPEDLHMSEISLTLVL
jgi:hypothetical protein